MDQIKEKILIADDHGVVRMGLSLMIKKLKPHFTVDETEDYQQVMNIIKNNTFCLVILDINMPNGTFSETLRAIKLKHPQTKVLIFSSQDESIYALRYLKMGADGFLHKLSSEHEINQALIKMLDKGSYISDEVKDSVIFNKLNNQTILQNPLEALSDREMEIAERLITGEPIKQISNDLNIHTSTVSTYKTRIFQKLIIQTIPELIKVFDFHHISKL